jgi:hypothetical protein
VLRIKFFVWNYCCSLCIILVIVVNYDFDSVPLSLMKFKYGKNESQNLCMVKWILTLFHSSW